MDLVVTPYIPKRWLAGNQFCSKTQQWTSVSGREQISSNALLLRVPPSLGLDLVVTPLSPNLSWARNRFFTSIKTSILHQQK